MEYRPFGRTGLQVSPLALGGLGANPERVFVTGNIKFDRVQSDRSQPKTQELRQAFGIEADETVLIAGSTQAPEEMYALDAWRMLRQDFPRLRPSFRNLHRGHDHFDRFVFRASGTAHVAM